MIKDKGSFNHAGLAEYWENPDEVPAKLNPTLAKRARLVLAHLESATSYHDLRTGLGEQRRFHGLQPASENRYSLDVNGNYRITFEIVDKRTGEVTAINLEDTH